MSYQEYCSYHSLIINYSSYFSNKINLIIFCLCLCIVNKNVYNYVIYEIVTALQLIFQMLDSILYIHKMFCRAVKKKISINNWCVKYIYIYFVVLSEIEFYRINSYLEVFHLEYEVNKASVVHWWYKIYWQGKLSCFQYYIDKLKEILATNSFEINYASQYLIEIPKLKFRFWMTLALLCLN